ncbi:hypothetical protein [Psychromicrobium sp. YIM B11713]|uniref:hypothetical protein n=1 Tax=Psychromicrobium sp. YIM B11713 TaxID=3145233 RepID=UPI00374F4584
MKFARTAIASVGLTVVLLGAAVGPANAIPQGDDPVTGPGTAHPMVCEGGTFYDETHSDVYLGNPSKRVYGSGGGTLKFDAGESASVTGTLSTTVSADANFVFGKVSASAGMSIALSKTATTPVGYSWTVPAGRTGYIEMGAHGYRISYTKYHYKSPCTQVIDKKDTITGATGNAYFTHN